MIILKLKTVLNIKTAYKLIHCVLILLFDLIKKSFRRIISMNNKFDEFSHSLFRITNHAYFSATFKYRLVLNTDYIKCGHVTIF